MSNAAPPRIQPTPEPVRQETRTIHDPFTGKDAVIDNGLVNRLRGKYACGPTLPSGEPEFGWRQMETPPISHEAADRIEELEAALRDIQAKTEGERHTVNEQNVFKYWGLLNLMMIEIRDIARAALPQSRGVARAPGNTE